MKLRERKSRAEVRALVIKTDHQHAITARRLRQDGPAGRPAGAASTAARSPASIDPAHRSHGGGTIDDPRWDGVDVAIDFSTPERGGRQRAGAGATRHQPGGRHDRLAGARGRAARRPIADAGVGVVAAPNFSTGVVLFEAIVAHAAKLFAAQDDFGAFLHEAHHAAKKDAPSGTALLLKRAMEDAGYHAADRRRRRRAPGSFPARTRSVSTARPKSITLTHTARDRTAFARGALAAARWVEGKQGLVHDARCAWGGYD